MMSSFHIIIVYRKSKTIHRLSVFSKTLSGNTFTFLVLDIAISTLSLRKGAIIFSLKCCELAIGAIEASAIFFLLYLRISHTLLQLIALLFLGCWLGLSNVFLLD